MFYDTFKTLCKRKGISCNKAALEIGLSNATPTKWKKTGAMPDSSTLTKIASYFNVSTDYLLTGEEKEKPVPEGDELDRQLDGIDFALYGEVKALTDAQKRDVLRFVKFIKQGEK